MPLPSGKDHHRWAGNKVGYVGIHTWIKNRKTLTGRCEWCGAEPKPIIYNVGSKKHTARGTDLHNISGEYKRDVKDYVELCRLCHAKTKSKTRRGGMRARDENVV